MRLLIIALSTLLLVGTVSGQQPQDIHIADIEILPLKWGRQKATFTIGNSSDYIRYLAVVTEMQFSGTHLNPRRAVRKHYIVEPAETKTVITDIVIPGNYGNATLTFSVYDLVDTLDALLSSQLIHSQTFDLQFKPPSSVLPYLQHPLSLPPMVTNSPIFDNEFSHVLLALVHEKKHVAEIAEIAQADSSFVQQIVDSLIQIGYLEKQPGSLLLTFPFLPMTFAAKGRVLAEELAKDLSDNFAKDVKSHRAVLDSLIMAGKLNKDSNDFMGGGSILFQPYPLVTAFVLWVDLGPKFVCENQMLTPLAYTDPCNAVSLPYMYAVAGGANNNGRQYFNLTMYGRRYEIEFGEPVPQVICPRDESVHNSLQEHSNWRFKDGWIGETFVFDGALVQIIMRRFTQDLDTKLTDAGERLQQLAEDSGQPELKLATRYWFWNLVATLTTDRLCATGLIKPNQNGQYKLILKTGGAMPTNQAGNKNN